MHFNLVDMFFKGFLLLIVLNRCFIIGYSSWMIIANIGLSSPFGRHMCEQMPLVKQQKSYCERDPTVIASVRDGTKMSINECQYQFRNSRWNCTAALNRNQGIFGKVIQRGSQEAAFVHAITSAGVAYAVTQACSRGDLEHCSCDKKKRGPNKDNSFVWGGCSDDVKYGMKFAEKFVDATETNRFDARANMNRHNNRVGRRAVKKFTRRKCKCHGPTTTCATRTCWDELKDFRFTGAYLKSLYDVASHVTVKQDGSIIKNDASVTTLEPPSKEQLVYLETSPNYCIPSPETGSLGTAGRECNKTSRGEDSCRSMCCGRGYDTKRVVRVRECKCKFHWCCRIICQNCSEEVDVHTCKGNDNGVLKGHSLFDARENSTVYLTKTKNSSESRKTLKKYKKLSKTANKTQKKKNKMRRKKKHKTQSKNTIIRAKRIIYFDEHKDYVNFQKD